MQDVVDWAIEAGLQEVEVEEARPRGEQKQVRLRATASRLFTFVELDMGVDNAPIIGHVPSSNRGHSKAKKLPGESCSSFKLGAAAGTQPAQERAAKPVQPSGQKRKAEGDQLPFGCTLLVDHTPQRAESE